MRSSLKPGKASRLKVKRVRDQLIANCVVAVYLVDPVEQICFRGVCCQLIAQLLFFSHFNSMSHFLLAALPVMLAAC